MPFTLHEAPLRALKAIQSEKVSRGCGKFWAIFFCCPSIGSSIWGDGDGCKPRKELEEETGYSTCCWPAPVSEGSDLALGALIGILEELMDINKIPIDLRSNLESNHELIEWQVKATLKVLNTACNSRQIEGSYKPRLKNIYDAISAKASLDQQFGEDLNSEKSPITGHLIANGTKYGLVR